MKNIQPKSGQSILAIIMWGAGISIPFIAGSYYFVSSKFAEVNKVNLNQESRVATIEEAIKTIKDDNKEIKADIKILLQRIK